MFKGIVIHKFFRNPSSGLLVSWQRNWKTHEELLIKTARIAQRWCKEHLIFFHFSAAFVGILDVPPSATLFGSGKREVLDPLNASRFIYLREQFELPLFVIWYSSFQTNIIFFAHCQTYGCLVTYVLPTDFCRLSNVLLLDQMMLLKNVVQNLVVC